MNKEFKENQMPIESLEPEIIVTSMAYLDDLGGKKYFLKDEKGRHIWLDNDLKSYQIVDEATVFSAVLKHGYTPIEDKDKKQFKFGERKEYL